MSSIEENKALMCRYYNEVWRKGNLAAIDELIAIDIVDHMPWPGQPPGRQGHAFAVGGTLKAFPDGQYTIGDVIGEGDKTVGRWTMRATHQGSIMGIPPTGKTMTMSGIDIFRWENGKAAEFWHIEEVFSMLQQLCVIPPSG